MECYEFLRSNFSQNKRLHLPLQSPIQVPLLELYKKTFAPQRGYELQKLVKGHSASALNEQMYS
jgi:hypothetical protein